MPLLRVELEFEFNGVRMTRLVPGLLDSGADCAMGPFEFFEGTGVSYESLPETPGKNLGAGGEFEARLCKAKISWEGTVISEEIKVIQAGSKLPFILLGRNDFFAKYTIRFSWHRMPPTIDIDPATAPKKRA